MNKSYQPIDCTFLSKLEDAATLGHFGSIIYQAEDGAIVHCEDRIITWIAENGIEYLLTRGGQKIRMDRLIKVFDMPNPSSVCYKA